MTWLFCLFAMLDTVVCLIPIKIGRESYCNTIYNQQVVCAFALFLRDIMPDESETKCCASKTYQSAYRPNAAKYR